MRRDRSTEFILIFSGAGQTKYFCEFMVEDLWCCKYARQPDFRALSPISLANLRVSWKKKKNTTALQHYPNS